jgi:hypothetical protein
MNNRAVVDDALPPFSLSTDNLFVIAGKTSFVR